MARAKRARSGSGTSQRFSRSSRSGTSESVRGKRAGPDVAVAPSPRGRLRPRKRLRERHHGIAGFAHRRAEVFVRRGLEPTAEILLLGQQVAQRLGERRMVARQADSKQRPGKLASRVDRTAAGSGIDLVPAAVGVLKGEQGSGLALDLARILRFVDQPPGVEPMDPVLEVLEPPVGGALAQDSRDIGGGLGEVVAVESGAASSERTRQSRQAKPNLLSSGMTPLSSSGGRSRRDSHARSQERSESLDRLGLLPRNLTLEVEQDAALLALSLKRDRR